MIDIGKKAKEAIFDLPTNTKNDVLDSICNALNNNKESIIDANQKDIDQAHQNNMPQPLIDRLRITEERIQDMISSIQTLIALDDPINEVIATTLLDNGLTVEKTRVPLGVIGIIYESRPNVTVDAFTLCFKAGNVVILKGGKEALNTNIALEAIIQDVLKSYNLNPNIIQVVKATNRSSTHELMKMNEYIDVLIPRGSAALIQTVINTSTIPVIETGAGNCHIYVDETFDENMAIDIIKNAKLQRLGVCNAAESLVLHKQASSLLPKIVDELDSVTFYGDSTACHIDKRIQKASQEDFYTEYLDKKLSVVIVDSLEEAIKHINKYSTKHSEAIITRNTEHAEKFLNHIDSACVYVNASTRFTDGYEMGLGAEIGISTQKLHARGPMGLTELTSYKYKIRGTGQIRK